MQQQQSNQSTNNSRKRSAGGGGAKRPAPQQTIIVKADGTTVLKRRRISIMCLLKTEKYSETSSQTAAATERVEREQRWKYYEHEYATTAAFAECVDQCGRHRERRSAGLYGRRFRSRYAPSRPAVCVHSRSIVRLSFSATVVGVAVDGSVWLAGAPVVRLVASCSTRPHIHRSATRQVERKLATGRRVRHRRRHAERATGTKSVQEKGAH